MAPDSQGPVFKSQHLVAMREEHVVVLAPQTMEKKKRPRSDLMLLGGVIEEMLGGRQADGVGSGRDTGWKDSCPLTSAVDWSVYTLPHK